MTREERAQGIMRYFRRCYRFIHFYADGGKASQWTLLRELRFHGSMTQRMLQEHVGIRQSSLSELVKKLEEQGVIRRQTCEDDRRQIIITLTEKGTALLEEAQEQNLRQQVEHLSVLTEEEQETLYVLMSKLNAHWNGEGRK